MRAMVYISELSELSDDEDVSELDDEDDVAELDDDDDVADDVADELLVTDELLSSSLKPARKHRK